MSGFPGLAEALAAAEVAETERLRDVAEQMERAAQLRAELHSGTVTDQAEAQRKHAQVALIEEAARVGSAGQGERNYTLNRAAFSLGQLVAAGTLDEVDAVHELSAAGQSVGLGQQEIQRTIESGLSAGKKSPRDLSKVGSKAGRSKRVKVPLPVLMMDVDTLPNAEDIPSAGHQITEGRVDYSDLQLTEMLGLSDWRVTAPDTDTAHAHRLAELASGNLLYTSKLGGWLAYTGDLWATGAGRRGDGVGDLLAQRLAQQLSTAMKPEVEWLFALYGVLAPVPERAGDAHALERAAWNYVKAQRSVEGRSRQKSILESARSLLMVDHERFEPRPWVLGFQNGVWDAGEWREHKREDHMLTLAPVEYHQDADQTVWLEVLKRMTGGDADLAQSLQDVTGYVLSGASNLRLLLWLYGPKGTGKSTFAELLGTLLGDMAATVDTKLFAADSNRERLGAAVWGKLAVFCAEAGNARLDAELLKTLSGGDRLAVRFLFCESFTSLPRHVLLMVANDAPKVDAYDDALKDRVYALPFLHPLSVPGHPPLVGGQRIESVRRDPRSALVLGFTAWAVDGLIRVHTRGDIHRAQAAIRATERFWADVDPLWEFWLDVGREAFAGNGITAAELRNRYETWAEGAGVRPYAMKQWGQACASVGLENVRRTGGMRYWTLKQPGMFPNDAADQRRGSDASDATEPVPKSFQEEIPM